MGEATLSIISGVIIALAGLGLLALGGGVDLLSWLMVAVGVLNAGIGVFQYVVGRRRRHP